MPERLLTRPFVLASLATFTHGMAFALFIHFPGFLEDLGATEVIIGLIVGFAAVASIVVRPWVGRAMDRLVDVRHQAEGSRFVLHECRFRLRRHLTSRPS